MTDQDNPPEPPGNSQSQGQTAESLEDQRELIARSEAPAAALTQGLPEALIGLGAQSQEVTFNLAGLAALITVLKTQTDAAREATRQLIAERTLSTEQAERAGKAATRAEVAEARLDGQKESSGIRMVGTTVGAVLLGLLPFAAEKAQAAGALVTGFLGGVLLLSAWLWPRQRTK